MGIIAQRRDGFQCHGAAALDGRFIVLFEQQGADEAGDGVLVGEVADHISAALDLPVHAFERIGRVQLGTMCGREAHVGQHIGLRLVEEGGELGQLGAQLVGDAAPLGPRRFGIVLRERCGDEGRYDAPAPLAGMRHGIAHEMHAAALPGGIQDLADRGLDALMGVGDYQLHAAQAPPRQLAQERGPERLRLGRPDVEAEHLAPAV